MLGSLDSTADRRAPGCRRGRRPRMSGPASAGPAGRRWRITGQRRGSVAAMAGAVAAPRSAAAPSERTGRPMMRVTRVQRGAISRAKRWPRGASCQWLCRAPCHTLPAAAQWRRDDRALAGGFNAFGAISRPSSPGPGRTPSTLLGLCRPAARPSRNMGCSGATRVARPTLVPSDGTVGGRPTGSRPTSSRRPKIGRP